MNRIREAPKKAARVRCINPVAMRTYINSRTTAAIQKAGVI
jgi:hypothetical protein